MTVTVDMLNAYSGNYEDSEAAAALKESFLEAAWEITSEYLGFDPEEREYVGVRLDGSGTDTLYLPARNVTEVTALSAGGAEQDLSVMTARGDRIERADGAVFPRRGRKHITVSFTAGWDAETMPAAITVAVLRIATLMLQETGGNIGLSGKSFADSSRTFVSYSNYRKYLEPLAPLRTRGF